MIAGFEQFFAAQRQAVEAFQAVTVKAIEGAQKIADLNVQASKANLADAAEMFNALTKAKDPSAAIQEAVAFAKPIGDKSSAYAKHMYDIVSTTGQSIASDVKVQLDAAQEAGVAAFETAAQNAPAGSEPIFAAAKNAFTVVRGGMDQAIAASKKLTDFAEQNVSTLQAKPARARKAA
jgi:phasin family protein